MRLKSLTLYYSKSVFETRGNHSAPQEAFATLQFKNDTNVAQQLHLHQR